MPAQPQAGCFPKLTAIWLAALDFIVRQAMRTKQGFTMEQPQTRIACPSVNPAAELIWSTKFGWQTIRKGLSSTAVRLKPCDSSIKRVIRFSKGLGCHLK